MCDQPQRWAAAPAVFFMMAGLISLIGSDTVSSVFSWVWPPVLLGLVVWMMIRARWRLRSRTRRCLAVGMTLHGWRRKRTSRRCRPTVDTV